MVIAGGEVIAIAISYGTEGTWQHVGRTVLTVCACRHGPSNLDAIGAVLPDTDPLGPEADESINDLLPQRQG